MTMKQKRILFFTAPALVLVVAIIFASPFKQKTTGFGNLSPSFESDSVTFWVSGDAMMHMPQYKAAYNDSIGLCEFDSCYTYIRPILQNADIRIINFETTLAGKPYSGFPRFSAPKEFADALRGAGFNFFVFANNHCCDRGAAGLSGNISYADSVNLWHTGIFRDPTERMNRYPFILEIKGWKIAILNYTYGTNGIREPKPFIVNRIDSAQIIADIKKAKSNEADAILVCIHWGEEYQHKQNSHQKALADFLLENGVDVIIGSHPHVVQPMELITPIGSMKERLVIWSLGNFISNQKDPFTDAGLLVGFTLKRTSFGKPKVCNVKFIPLYRLKLEGKKPGYYLMPGMFTEKNIETLIPGKDNIEDFLSVMGNTRKKVNTSPRIREVEK
jgi:poly-gamma-glutamate synthesis protein (capsule biosynthesis protein)